MRSVQSLLQHLPTGSGWERVHLYLTVLIHIFFVSFYYLQVVILLCRNLDLCTLFPHSSCIKVFGLFAPPTSDVNICRKGLFMDKVPSPSRWSFVSLPIHLVLIQAKSRPGSLQMSLTLALTESTLVHLNQNAVT